MQPPKDSYVCLVTFRCTFAESFLRGEGVSADAKKHTWKLRQRSCLMAFFYTRWIHTVV